MAYTFLGTFSHTAGATLTASVVDSAGTALGSQPASSIVDLGGGMWHYYTAAMPDGHIGTVLILESATPVAGIPVSPIETENADAKTSARTLAAADYATAASQTTIASYIDTEVAAIKAKTDNLPASPAATGDIPSAATIATQVNATLSGVHGAGSWGAGEGSTGDGDVAVDHNGGAGVTVDGEASATDILRYVDDGEGVDGVVIRGYLKASYDAGSKTVLGTTFTGSDGRWIAPLNLDAGTYYVIAHKQAGPNGGGYAAQTSTVVVA